MVICLTLSLTTRISTHTVSAGFAQNPKMRMAGIGSPFFVSAYQTEVRMTTFSGFINLVCVSTSSASCVEDLSGIKVFQQGAMQGLFVKMLWSVNSLGTDGRTGTDSGEELQLAEMIVTISKRIIWVVLLFLLFILY